MEGIHLAQFCPTQKKHMHTLTATHTHAEYIFIHHKRIFRAVGTVLGMQMEGRNTWA